MLFQLPRRYNQGKFMVNGLYTAAAGMMHLQKKQDVESNNLANANSTGFKLARLMTKTSISIQRNEEGKYHQDEDQNLDEVKIAFVQGPMVQTDNDMDIAIAGEGFFALETDNGYRYTRQGSLALNALGELVTLTGDPVLSDSGDRILIEQGKFTVMEDGGIFINGEKRTNIGIFQFKEGNLLIPRGSGHFENLDERKNSAEPVENPKVQQGYLEGSNVSVIDSMVRIITQFRNYEASQKSLHAIDDTLKKAVTEVGRVG